MRQTTRLAAIGSAVCFLLVGTVLVDNGHGQSPAVQASDAWARRAPAMGSMGKMDKMGSMEKSGSMGKMEGMGGGNGAIYVTLTNPGDQAASLVSATCEAAQTTELHEVQHDGGVMKMRPVSAIPVPAHGKTVLKPGGYHIMLLGLKQDLKPGEKVPVTLKFDQGGEVRVEALVK